jgi:N-acyl-D-aspartate/D-glutamate deacylase
LNPPRLLIRDGLLVDGTGGPAFAADLAIDGGRIHAIGSLKELTALEVISARGLVVAPGFIDLHSHGDLIWAWPDGRRRRALVEGRLAQGITTEILGNCGLGAAPLLGLAAPLLQELNGWMSPASYDWSWGGFGGFLEHIERLGLPLNVGSLVPHGALRAGVMGLRAGEPDGEAMARMQRELRGALEAGAFGLSAGLIYPPGMYAPTKELIELARQLEGGKGFFACHVRGSSETLLPAVEELLRIGWDAGVPVHHSHAEAVGRAHWGKIERLLELEDRARQQGLRVSFDMFPYPVAATMMLAIYPPWSLAGGLPRLLQRLGDPAERRRIERDIQEVAPEWPPWREGGWPHNLVRAVGWDRIQVASVGSERNRRLEGLSLEDLGRRAGKSPFEAISDLMLEEQGNVGQFVLDISGEAGLERLAVHPGCAFVSDANDYGKGKPHPAAYGSFPRILGRYVRERRALPLAEAVRRMSSLPADILGLADRGRLKEGAWADIVLFDPKRVADRATLGEPRAKPEGIEAILVNGEVACRRGAMTGAEAGRVLRRA